jgi:hypothetical protein
VVVVVVVVRTPTPNYLRQASQNLGKYLLLNCVFAYLLLVRFHAEKEEEEESRRAVLLCLSVQPVLFSTPPERREP